MPGRRVAWVLAGMLVWLAASVVPLAAQGNPDADNSAADSQLAGAVHTADGTAIPGATLRVTQTTTGMAWVTWTDEDGKFEFPALPAGHFRVEFSQLGFAPAPSEIDLAPGVKTPLDMKMEVGTLAAIAAASAVVNAAKTPSTLPANESANSAPAGAKATNGTTSAASNSAAAANNNSTAASANGRNGGANGAQRGGGGRNGQQGGPGGQGGGRRAFQQVGLNGENQNPAETGSEDQTLPVTGGQLGQTASADAVQMIGTVAMGQMPPGGFPQDGGPGGPEMQGAFGIGGNAIPGQPGAQGFGGPGGGPGGPGGPGGGPPGGGFAVVTRGGGGARGGGGRGRGPQDGAQSVAALWGVDRLMRQRANRVHFSFYDTFGDTALDARPYSLYEANPSKVPGWTESAGLNIGGPLKIPHLYDGTDKTFFFINFGGTWSRNPVDSFAVVPTGAERLGNFTNVMLYDPVTGQPLAGCPQSCSILPASSTNYTPQEQVAQSLLSYIPQPNIPVTNIAGQNFNYHLQTNLPGLSNRLNVNVTHQINSKLSLQVNYNLANATSHGLSNFPGIEGNTFTRGQSVMISLTQNWTKTFLHSSQLYFSRNRARGLNEFSNVDDVSAGLGCLPGAPIPSATCGLQGISTSPYDYGLPSVNFTNFTGINDPNFSLARSQSYRYVDAFRWIETKHTINIGGEVRKMDINRDTDPAPNGQFSFTGQLTSFNRTNGGCDPSVPGIACGNDFADFLLGYPANTKVQFSGATNSTATYFRNWGFVGYAQDDWHMFPKFTLTYGVRYEAFTPPTEVHGHIANLEVGPNFPIPQCITPVAADQNGLNCVAGPNASLFRGHYNNWAPRLGIAWQPPGKWFSGQHQLTLRAGFSMFYVEAYLNTLASEMANQPPFATASTLTQQPAPTFPSLNFLTNLSSALPGTVTNTVAVNPNYQVPYAMIWNGGLEYNITRSTFLEVMYTGTRGVHLDELLGFGPSTSGTTKAAGYTYDTTGAFSNLNALQVRLQKRMSRGLMFMARYTYSKSLDNASTIGGGAQTVLQNNSDPRLDYGLSSFNMTHQFLGQFSYALPFGDRQRFATKGWEKNVFGAWRVNATGTVNSGTPFTVRVFSKDQACQNVPGVNSERANQSGNPALPDPTTLEWFNTAVFRAPTGCLGNAARNSVIGPGTFTINSGLTKTIQFGRDGLRRLDFSWNTTNLLNHPNYSGLSTVFGSSTFGEITSVGAMRAMTFTTRINF